MFDGRPVGADTAQTQADRQTPLQIQIYESMCRRGSSRKQLAHVGRPARSLCCQLQRFAQIRRRMLRGSVVLAAVVKVDVKYLPHDLNDEDAISVW